MASLQSSVLIFPLLLGGMAIAQTSNPPQKVISNGSIHAVLYLPNASNGYYRGTRFDWSGVIGSLQYGGHDYYGPWFTRTDPKVIDFIYNGPDIVAGPCSAITGPVEEFSTGGKGLGYDEAKAGGVFIKIGVGVLRRPDESGYNAFRLYELVDGGKRSVRAKRDSIVFTQELKDPGNGYAYVYVKTIRLVPGKPVMVIEHRLKNVGSRPIETSVYDHNFLTLDKQPTGPDFTLSFPFSVTADSSSRHNLLTTEQHRLLFRKLFTGRDTAFATLTGFGTGQTDYHVTVENTKLKAGVKIQGDHPMAREHFWAIRSVLAIEPFIDLSIAPGQETTWSYTYTYF